MQVIYDPLGKFSSKTDKELEWLCQVVVYWATAAMVFYKTMHEVITEHYGYQLDPFSGGSVSEEGVYSYPEDPDLYPICKIITKKEIVFFYEYEILSIRQKSDGTVLTIRVD